ALLNIVLALLIAGGAYVCVSGEPIPELQAAKIASGTFSLQQRLFAEQDGKPPRRAILVAASGGGTRAALYATAVLQGLDQAKALDDVVLLSGVSGGSAAIADYLLHRNQFAGDFQGALWTKRAEAMSAPFIDDVLRGL